MVAGKKARSTGAHTNANEFRPIDYVKITIFGFALSALWGSLHTVILQVRLLDFVAEQQKNTYLGLLSGTGLILALVAQPIVGAISDRSSFTRGRRSPYILLGTLLVILFLPGVGLSDSYGTLFIVYCLLQVSSNIAQGPYQGFIPDLVPEQKRGLASGIKSLLEIIGGVALVRLVAIFIDRYFVGGGSSWLWLALAIPGIVLLGTMIATVLTVKEEPRTDSAKLPVLSVLFESFRVDTKATPDFIWFIISRLLVLMAFATLQRFALYYFMDVVGISNPAVVTADLLLTVGICMVVVVYPAGRLSDRAGRKPIVFLSALLGALAIVLLFLSQSYVQIILIGGLLGISSGAFMSTNWALATDLLPRGEEAKYLGLANVATAGAGALALFSIGPAIDLFNAYSPNLGYSVMLLICFICFVAGAVLLMKIKGRVNQNN